MTNYISQNEAVYNSLASQYEKKRENYSKEHDLKTSELFRKHLKNLNGKAIKILELGVGSGLTLSNFGELGYDTTGIDFSQNMLDIAKKIAKKTQLLLGEFITFNFNDKKYNGIYAQAFIHLFTKEDAKKVLTKIYDLLDNDGVTHISTTVHEVSEEGFFEKVDYEGGIRRFRRKWNEQELLNEITNVGFKIKEKIYINEEGNNKKWVIIIAIKE